MCPIACSLSSWTDASVSRLSRRAVASSRWLQASRSRTARCSAVRAATARSSRRPAGASCASRSASPASAASRARPRRRSCWSWRPMCSGTRAGRAGRRSSPPRARPRSTPCARRCRSRRAACSGAAMAALCWRWRKTSLRVCSRRAAFSRSSLRWCSARTVSSWSSRAEARRRRPGARRSSRDDLDLGAEDALALARGLDLRLRAASIRRRPSAFGRESLSCPRRVGEASEHEARPAAGRC